MSMCVSGSILVLSVVTEYSRGHGQAPEENLREDRRAGRPVYFELLALNDVRMMEILLAALFSMFVKSYFLTFLSEFYP